jgi:hypothetical protein
MHKAHEMIVINLNCTHELHKIGFIWVFKSEAAHKDKIEVLFYEKKIYTVMINNFI